MWETLQTDPEKFGAVLMVAVIAVAILVGAGIDAWRKNEAHKREIELKMELANRGMSAAEIERVLAAKSSRVQKPSASESDGVRARVLLKTQRDD